MGINFTNNYFHFHYRALRDQPAAPDRPERLEPVRRRGRLLPRRLPGAEAGLREAVQAHRIQGLLRPQPRQQDRRHLHEEARTGK